MKNKDYKIIIDISDELIEGPVSDYAFMIDGTDTIKKYDIAELIKYLGDHYNALLWGRINDIIHID